MSEHDATSVVGQMAGLADPAKVAHVTPKMLADAFCQGVVPGLVSHAHGFQRDDALRAELARGFCGWSGFPAETWRAGFDDGYSFMGSLTDRGWKPLPAKGDWPYSIYLTWPGDRPAIAHYCEADLAVWVFDDAAAASAFYKTLEDCP